MFACADFIKASKQCLWCIGSNLQCIHWLHCSAYWTVFCRIHFEVSMLKCAAVNSAVQCRYCLWCRVCSEQTNRRLRLPPTQFDGLASLCRVLGNNLTVLQLAQVSALSQEKKRKMFFFSGAKSSWHSIEGRARRFKEDIGLHQFEANLMTIRFHHHLERVS